MVTFVLSAEPLFSVRSHCFGQRGYCLRMRTEHVTQRVTENMSNLVQLCTFVLTEEQLFVIKWVLFCDFATS